MQSQIFACSSIVIVQVTMDIRLLTLLSHRNHSTASLVVGRRQVSPKGISVSNDLTAAPVGLIKSADLFDWCLCLFFKNRWDDYLIIQIIEKHCLGTMGATKHQLVMLVS